MANLQNIYNARKKNQGLTGRALLNSKKKKVDIDKQPIDTFTSGKSDTGSEQRYKVPTQTNNNYKPTSYKQTNNQETPLNTNYQSANTDNPQNDFDLKVKAQMAQDQQDFYDAGKDLFGDEDNPISKSSLDVKVSKSIEQRKADELVQKQKEQEQYLKDQQARQAELEQIQYGRLTDQVKGATSSITANFSQGRNNPFSANAPQLIDEFNTQMQTRVHEANVQLESAKAQRERALKDLQDAQKSGKSKMVEAYAKRLASAEARVQERDTAYLNAVNDTQKLALDVQYKTAQINAKAFDTFESMPVGSIADMDIQNISAMFGVDETIASTLQALDKSRGAIDPNDPLYQLKQAQIDGQINEAKWKGMTSQQKNFMQYQDLLKVDPAQAKQFAEYTGISDVLSVKEAFDNQNKTNKQALDFYTENGFFPPNGKYKTFVDPNNKTVSFGVEEGQAVGQCGRFGNDCLGIDHFFTNMLKEKTDKINTYNPGAGFAGVMDVGTKYGHIFMVENVNDDGSLDIVQSNWNNDEKVTRDTLMPGTSKYKSIVGFVNPALLGNSKSNNPLDKQMDMMLTQMRSGHITDSDISKARLLATKTGREDEFQTEVSNPKNKLLQENTANKFGVPTDLTRRELDKIVDKRTDAGYGNRKFQQVMFTANSQGNKELDNIRELYRMRRDLRLVDALQKGNGTLLHPNPKGSFADLSEEDKQYLQDYYGIKDEFWKGVETGPVEGRLSALISKTGYNDPSFLAIQSIMGKYTADYMKSISGAAISEREAERLSGLIPNVNQQEAKFHSNLSTAKRELDFKLRTNAREWGFKDADNAISKIDSIGMGALDDITDDVMKEARQFNFYGNSQQLEEDKNLYNSYIDEQIKYPDDL